MLSFAAGNTFGLVGTVAVGTQHAGSAMVYSVRTDVTFRAPATNVDIR